MLSAAVNAVRRRLRGTAVQRWPAAHLLYAWYVRYLSRSLPGGSDWVRVSFRGLELEIERGDITILPTLLTGEYESEELDAVLPLVTTASTFVDVGANVGVYSLLAARLVGDAGRVVALEPNPATVRLLERNIEQNGSAGRVEVVPLALADVEAELPWVRTRFQGTGRLAAATPADADGTVRSTTLDALADSLDLDLGGGVVKIDVEGFEPHVICGGERVIRRDRPALLVEVCGRSSDAVAVSWNGAIAILAETYDLARVFGPRAVARASIADVLAEVLADGRQHNVLLRRRA